MMSTYNAQMTLHAARTHLVVQSPKNSVFQESAVDPTSSIHQYSNLRVVAFIVKQYSLDAGRYASFKHHNLTKSAFRSTSFLGRQNTLSMPELNGGTVLFRYFALSRMRHLPAAWSNVDWKFCNAISISKLPEYGKILDPRGLIYPSVHKHTSHATSSPRLGPSHH